jgi:3-dehydroquinate dehydratase
MKKKPVEIRKIPLEDFINLLIDMHDDGARYIDIVAYPDNTQDMMTVIVREEYMKKTRRMPDKPLRELNMDELISLL